MTPTATTTIETATTALRATHDPYINTADLYDYVGPYKREARGDVDFYVNLSKEIGGRTLEVGCGTGRVLIPTAQAGIEITGIDTSQAMLDVCRQKLASLPENLQKNVWLTTGDMRNFDLEEQFDLITIPFRPFQHMLTVEDQIATLSTIRRHLKPNGTFVFDIFNPSIPGLADETRLEQAQTEPEVVTPDGRRFIRSHKFVKKDFFNQVNDLELIHDVIWPDGTHTQEIFAFQMRYFFRFEIEHLLVRCGFAIDTIYSGFDKQPYGSRYPGDLVIVARRA
jgi:SAM-dependent methyltransferase